MNRLTTLHILLAVAVLIPLVYASPACLGSSGSPVDWWVMIKIPVVSGGNQYEDGYHYLYADVTSQSLNLVTNNDLNTKTNPLYYTVNQAFTLKSQSQGYFAYNDQTPDDNSHDSYGHTKGLMVFDSSAGFWLVHSVPKFPDFNGSYTYPPDQSKYGQSFLCMNMNAVNLNTAASVFLYNKPFVYAFSMTSALNATYTNVERLLSKQFVTSPGQTLNVQLHSLAGSVFQQFGKNANWNNTLYESAVSPFFKVGFYWETWQDGDKDNVMPSFCTPTYPYDEINVDSLDFQGKVQWLETQDHSKWGIAMTTGNGYITCIGDINRQWSQDQRGGGTVCFKNTNIWKSFDAMLKTFEKCAA